ncbi:MAG: hypothetical protein AB1714_31965 [Acidobacteriota bacterium]
MTTIQEHLGRVSDAAVAVARSLSELEKRVDESIGARGVPAAPVQRLLKLVRQAGRCASRLVGDIAILQPSSQGLFALDVSDMEYRLRGSARELAEPLAGIGALLEKSPTLLARVGECAGKVDEDAQVLAGTLFPSAVVGLGNVNQRLWDVRRKRLRDHRTAVRARFGEGSQAAELLRGLESRFEEVNRFLNDLVLQNLAPDRVAADLKAMQISMASAGTSPTAVVLKPLKGILSAFGRTAKAVEKGLRSLRIPIFPSHSGLEELGPAINSGVYELLTGHQKFALLNISARMRHTKFSGERNLLDPAFEIKVFRVFPDRIYLTAKTELVDVVVGMAHTGQFEPVTPALHAFRGAASSRSRKPGRRECCRSAMKNGRKGVCEWMQTSTSTATRCGTFSVRSSSTI